MSMLCLLWNKRNAHAIYRKIRLITTDYFHVNIAWSKIYFPSIFDSWYSTLMYFWVRDCFENRLFFPLDYSSILEILSWRLGWMLVPSSPELARSSFFWATIRLTLRLNCKLYLIEFFISETETRRNDSQLLKMAENLQLDDRAWI